MSRAKTPTFQQSLFNEADLKTSKHDEILIWLEETVRQDPRLVNSFLTHHGIWGKPYVAIPLSIGGCHDGVPEGLRVAVQSTALERAIEPPNEPAAKIRGATWEYPLRASLHSKRISAYVDLKVSLDRPWLRLDVEVESEWLPHCDPRRRREAIPDKRLNNDFAGLLERVWKIGDRGRVAFRVSRDQLRIGKKVESLSRDDRDWLKRNNDEILSALGTGILYGTHMHHIKTSNWRIVWDVSYVYFEVKTKIPSIGELLRQLQFYKTMVGESPIVVVAPDNAEAARVVRSQGFGFIAYPHS